MYFFINSWENRLRVSIYLEKMVLVSLLVVSNQTPCYQLAIRNLSSYPIEVNGATAMYSDGTGVLLTPNDFILPITIPLTVKSRSGESIHIYQEAIEDIKWSKVVSFSISTTLGEEIKMKKSI